MRLGYARVSTQDQSLDRQVDALSKAGCESIYQEKRSGKAASGREELANLMKALRSGDTLVICSLDRLGRSMTHLIAILHELESRSVAVESLKERIDTSTAAGKMFTGFIAIFAEYERNLLVERTKAGLESARARGRLGGRPKMLTANDVSQIRLLMADKSQNVSDVAKRFNVSRATLYRCLKDAQC